MTELNATEKLVEQHELEAAQQRRRRDDEMSQPDTPAPCALKRDWTEAELAAIRKPGAVIEIDRHNAEDVAAIIRAAKCEHRFSITGAMPHPDDTCVVCGVARKYDRPELYISAPEVLGASRRELDDRKRTYDAPAGERSMAKTVAAFNAIHGLGMTEVQGWQFMELLKIVRSAQGGFKLDNFVDGAAYAALAGEAAAKAGRR